MSNGDYADNFISLVIEDRVWKFANELSPNIVDYYFRRNRIEAGFRHGLFVKLKKPARREYIGIAIV